MDPNRIHWFCLLSSGASRMSDLRAARYRNGPGSREAVAYSDHHATMADLRAAHTMACGATPDDVDTCGILTWEATLRRRAARIAEVEADPWGEGAIRYPPEIAGGRRRSGGAERGSPTPLLANGSPIVVADSPERAGARLPTTAEAAREEDS